MPANSAKLGVDLIFDSDGLRSFGKNLDKKLSSTSKKWIKEIQGNTAEALEAAIGSALRDGRTEAAWAQFIRSPVEGMSRQIRGMIESNQTFAASILQEQFKTQVRLQKQLIDERKGALDDLHKHQLKHVDEQIDELKSGLQGVGQNILGGDFGALLDVLKSGGQKVRQRGLAEQQRSVEVGGRDPKLAANMAKMGTQMAKIGGSLMMVAAVAGSLVMLVKLFMDLETKVKDMNKALLDSAGAADFGLSAAEIQAGKLTGTLEDIRGQTTAVNDNFLKFRASAKEQQEILAQFNQAGVTFEKMNKEIESGREKMTSYSDVTALALTYSKALGISTGEATQQMGQFSMDTGLGLQDIAEQFSVITREAMSAGLSTKRFFSAVTEASSGMVFYGTRIEETTRLLSGFDTLLGESVGTEAFKQLVGRYQDKGMQDRIKELIVKDQEFTQGQFSNAYKRTLGGIVREFGKELESRGLDVEQVIKTAASEVELRSTLAKIGVQGAKQQQFLAAYRLRGAVEAGPGATAAGMAAMPYAGPGFDIALALKTALPLEDFGKSLGEVYETATRTNNQALLVALEQLAETSGKSLEQLIALDNQGRATYDRLREVREGVTEIMPNDLAKMGYFIDKQSREIRKGYFDATGQLVEENAVTIRDSFDVLTSTPTEGEDTMLEALTRDQQIASEIARNTSSTSDVLEQTVVSILNSIYGVVETIADFLADDRAKQQKLAAQREAKAQKELLVTQARTAEREVTELSKKFEAATKDGDKDLARQIQEQLEQAKKNATAAEMAVDRQDAVAHAVSNLTDEMVKGEGAGAQAILQAVESRSRSAIFGSDAERKEFLSTLDAALPRMAESNKEGWEYFKDEFGKNVEAVFSMGSPEDWADTVREKLTAPQFAGRIAGGSMSIEKAIARGMEAAQTAESQAGFFATEAEKQRGMAEAFSTAVSTAIAQQILPASTQKQQNDDIIKALEDLSKAQEGVSGFDVANLFLGQMRRAQDVIIPPQGRPILTDPRDTITAARPGGPIARSAQARNISININAYQNPNEIYNQVMRVVRTLGL